MTTDQGEPDPAPLRACPECGTEATPGGRFCRVCGTRLTRSDPDGVRAPARGGDPAAAPDTTSELPRVSQGTAEIPADTETSRRRCLNCGAPNSLQRELCGRCGADLDTGELTARPDPRPYPPLAFTETEDEGARRWLLLVLAVLGVAAVVVIGLAVAGLGPFDRGPEIPEADFDEQRYDDDPVRLALADIVTLSTLPPQGDESFDPAQMLDGDPTTAWNSHGGDDGPEHGVGEQIDVSLVEPAWIDRVVIANGYQRDPDTYASNARVMRAQLTVDGGLTFVISLLDEGRVEQAVEFRQPVLTTAVRIEILEVFPGDTYPDLAISELAFEGWPADPTDTGIAERRAEARPATGAATEEQSREPERPRASDRRHRQPL